MRTLDHPPRIQSFFFSLFSGLSFHNSTHTCPLFIQIELSFFFLILDFIQKNSFAILTILPRVINKQHQILFGISEIK